MKRIPWYQGRLWHGMDLFAWLRLLIRNRLTVTPTRIPMALTITCTSAVNTSLRGIQSLCFGRRIARVEITQDPIFIVGHWRTGTTMLHELLALDLHHRPPTTFESLVPNHFILSQRWLRHWLWFMLPRTRPMDNMRMSFDRPQEDEAALCLRGTPSPFATVAFPNRSPQYPEYVDLEELSPTQLRRWQSALRRYLKELLLVRPGRLLLKSPQHTFRLKSITQMFPQSQFIYVIRNPYDVFPSTVHFWRTMYASHGLQRPNFKTLHDDVFDTFAAMHRKFEETRGLLDTKRLYQVRYEDLVGDPVAVMRAIYKHFGWPGFDAIEPAVEQYAQRSQRYETNRYDLEPELRNEITRRWLPYIEKYGYGFSSKRSGDPAKLHTNGCSSLPT